ncbi:gliding motility-associated lipoprotein GldK [Dysgonomonas sp. 216]|uniref:type IX secretion system lipoprotein PorK/GldK n=1 Tax=Dysgonomonas sp. 216 TaxID=2302934 RepID=UPI0013D70778|nr:SUMF1/EgtB/PvdO family nonheme iron enzyme [Dysgonomonas sp. 216]NDW18326.1 gliding motility-associated lipoprotein GldK [Dysgonomonas sp. 216]NDW18694.1 gliding motility-associated lipoprotein GldK [Dysgonomonas sp. 216]
MKKLFFALVTSVVLLTSCGKPQGGSVGGELVGLGGSSWAEPNPYGMVLVSRGAYEMGPADSDSLWGIQASAKGVSVDAFWMDDTEITNSEYRQFVYWVRDSIIRERLADPAYGGDETFKITEDRYGDPVKPYLNWKKVIPFKRPTEDEERAILSVTAVHPITGQRGIDAAQMNFRYDWYDHTEAAKRRNRLNPVERVLNTDITVNPNEIIMISKDTAYIDEEGRIINQTITRPLSTLFDFYHSHIVNIYPDTTVWVNDFNNAYNEPYMRMYFSHPGYNDYPVVGVTWEQATAFCNWRTIFYRMGMGPRSRDIEPFRLPTEGEWEFAARNGKTENKYPWDSEGTVTDKGCFMANFKPGDGDYTQDGELITSRVASYNPNRYGLYDMAGNVSEWTSTTYVESGNAVVNDLNPEYGYNAAKEDPYADKKKVIKGGSWKDVGMFIRGDMRDFEYQNQPRSYIGFRCVRTQIGTSKSRR